jgi:hypothetical protein
MDELHKKLMMTLHDLREEGIDLKEDPVLIRWVYPEEPWIEFELLIREMDEAYIEHTESLH